MRKSVEILQEIEKLQQELEIALNCEAKVSELENIRKENEYFFDELTKLKEKVKKSAVKIDKTQLDFYDKLYFKIRNKNKTALAQLFDNAINSLTDREKCVIMSRFNESLTLEETAKKFDLTRERMRQIEDKAVKKIHKYIAEYTNYYKTAKETTIEKMEITINPKTSIEEFNMSVRLFNCLYRKGIKTIDELLLTIATGEIYNIRNLGNSCLNELKGLLARIGINPNIIYLKNLNNQPMHKSKEEITFSWTNEKNESGV